MHISKLAGFIIDCKTDDLQAAATFWGSAFGMRVRDLPGEEGKYVELVDPSDQLHIEVQSVSHTSRVHLDIESDDVEAEASRLEALGAKRCRRSIPGGSWKLPPASGFAWFGPSHRHLAQRQTNGSSGSHL